jgi:hypothetical protein
MVRMKNLQRILTGVVVVFGLFALGSAAVAATRRNHHDGKQLVGDKLKADGRHEIDKKGHYTTSVETKDGKIAGVHVKHDTKGDIPVKKYKTHKKMAQRVSVHIVNASFHSAQDQDMGTVYIGFAYTDDDGNEEIYWFPYDMVIDGGTGAVEYIAE